MNHNILIADASRNALGEHLVPSAAIDAAQVMLRHVIETASTVAREYDREVGDDSNLAGIMVARRAKNVAARELLAEGIPGIVVRPARGFTWDIIASGTRLHTYSAPGGLDAFQLCGGDRKLDIVERSIEQLSLIEQGGAAQPPGDLVLAYVRNTRGCERAALGVMQSESEFAWYVSVYDADSIGEFEAPTGKKAHPSFREQPDEQPDISLKRSRDLREKL